MFPVRYELNFYISFGRNSAFKGLKILLLVTLNIALVRSKLEDASVVWNSITSTDANKLERIQ
jgi:hypothetical protein